MLDYIKHIEILILKSQVNPDRFLKPVGVKIKIPLQ